MLDNRVSNSYKSGFINNRSANFYKGKPNFEPDFCSDYFCVRLKSTQYGTYTYAQYESIRKILNRYKAIKKKMYVVVRPFVNVTAKPIESRMGKGKGKFKLKIFPLRPGITIIEFRFFRMDSVPLDEYSILKRQLKAECESALRKIARRLSVRTVVTIMDI